MVDFKKLLKKDMEIFEFESLYEKTEYWNKMQLQVVNVMEEKLKAYKLKNPGEDTTDQDRNLLIMQQAQQSTALLLIDHKLLINEKASSSNVH